jgi:hypothetical protein
MPFALKLKNRRKAGERFARVERSALAHFLSAEVKNSWSNGV